MSKIIKMFTIKNSCQLLFSAIFVFSVFSLTGQTTQKYTDLPGDVGPDGFVRCAAMEVDQIRRQKNPNLPTRMDFENWMRVAKAVYKREEATKRNSMPDTLLIPCVIHILHNGESYGVGPNILTQQALSQINVLNEDYQRITGTRGDYGGANTDFEAVSADIEIKFVMAKTDPSGKATNGINRVNIGQDGANRDDIEGTIKPNTIWDPTMYLNLWSIKFAAPDDNLLGYAQFPEGSGLDGMPTGTEDASTDGVVQVFDAFGTIDYKTIYEGETQPDSTALYTMKASYAYGRTATHEVGHWVGLRHIWGDGPGCNLGQQPNPNVCSCMQDDFCADTPNSGEANSGCADDNTSSCEEDAQGLPVITVDMDENYMDYTSDDCMSIFTQDQKDRVRTVMMNSPRRMELPNSPALFPPGTYITFADKSSEVIEGTSCEAKTMEVDLLISAAPTADATVSFSFSGDATEGAGLDYTIAPSTIVFPAGQTDNKKVTITIYEDAQVETNETAIIAIETVTTTGDALKGFTNNTFTISLEDDDFPPEAAGRIPNQELLTEDFETGFNGWMVNSIAGASSEWIIGTATGGMLTNSAYVSLNGAGPYAYNGASESWSRLESPTIDASTATDLAITFDYICNGEEDAEAIYDFGSLYYSIDNGSNWIRFGPSYVGAVTTTNTTVDLPKAAERQSNLKVAFRWDNDGLLGQDPPFSVDNVVIKASLGSPTNIQTAVNSTNSDDQYLGPNATIHFYDPTTNNIMATVENMSDFDYGCTTVEIDRQGSNPTTHPFMSNAVAQHIMSKTLKVTPTNTNPSGIFNITLYYEEAEVMAWEDATGQSRANAKVIKVGGTKSISDVTPSNFSNFIINATDGTLGAYQTHVTFTAAFENGFSGFGIGSCGTLPDVTGLQISADDICDGEDGFVLFSNGNGLADGFYNIAYTIDGGTPLYGSVAFSSGESDLIISGLATGAHTINLLSLSGDEPCEVDISTLSIVLNVTVCDDCGPAGEIINITAADIAAVGDIATTFKAGDELKTTTSSSVVVATSQDITFRATNTISLLPGFHAQSGSDFLAIIGCNTPFTEEEHLSFRTNNSTPETGQVNLKVYPTVFTNQTNIELALPTSSPVQLDLFNLQGQRIKALISPQIREKGNYNMRINTNLLTEGIYFIRLQSGNEVITKKIIKIR